ncbi:MAG TPA: hypothetical protein PKD54_09980 [Pirellulaceae bacterium]|nr:hypothetical protein [Pirellulaceae bacterium]
MVEISADTDESRERAEPEMLEALALVAESSTPFVGRWHQLISQTNWEKGRIIHHWREKNQASPHAAAYSDETWSRLVGGVSPQHVGRLRRTFERFGDTWTSYAGLYWSHFYAALDWEDAELWLEGAVQNRWSVSQMRVQRWEALGSMRGQEPLDGDVVSAEFDEEAGSLAAGVSEAERIREWTDSVPNGPLPEGPDFGDERPFGTDAPEVATGEKSVEEVLAADYQPARLFEEFMDLPDDLEQAVEAMKLAILRYKSGGWNEISQEKVLRVLNALSRLAQQ